jgi:GAF domain-containing protein
MVVAEMKTIQDEASMKVNEPNTSLPEQINSGPDNDLRRAADLSRTRLLRTLLIISIVADVAALAASAAGGFGWQYLIPIGSLLIFAVASLIALSRGFPRPAQILLPASLFAVITYIIGVPPGYGLHDINLLAYAVVIILASLTLGQRGAFTFAFLIILAVWGIGLAETSGVIVSPTSSLTLFPVSPFAISIVILALTFIQRALMNLLNESVRRAQFSEREVIKRNAELQAIGTGLEQTVQERTSALQKRAAQLQAITELSETIGQVQDLGNLFQTTTHLISERFGFYHVGIFLIDNEHEYAILQAANSEGGNRMLARRHRLKLGTGVVGYVARLGQPRIALDVGADAVFFDNPDLPETRSEAALPLKARGQTIGVLDVQSREAGAFSTEDLHVLTALANQVAIAFENTRLLTEARAALRQVEEVYDEFTRAEWSRAAARAEQAGFRYQTGRIEMIEKLLHTPEVVSAVKTGSVVANQTNGSEEPRHTVAVPVKLRGEVIGVLQIESNDPSRTWQEDDISLVEAVAERAAFALENARLFQDARRRAAKERLISEATSRIGGALNLENILQTTAQELERVLGGSEVLIRFQTKEPK